RGKLRSAVGANARQGRSALLAKLRIGAVLVLALRALHLEPSRVVRSSDCQGCSVAHKWQQSNVRFPGLSAFRVAARCSLRTAVGQGQRYGHFWAKSGPAE